MVGSGVSINTKFRIRFIILHWIKSKIELNWGQNTGDDDDLLLTILDKS